MPKNKKYKYKQNTKKQKRLRIFWVILTVLIGIMVGIGIYLVVNKNPIDQNSGQTEAVKEGKTSEKDESLQEESMGEELPEPKVVAYESENPNNLAELTGAITVKYITNGILNVAAYSDQYVNQGKCIGRIKTSDGVEIRSQEVEMEFEAANSVCGLIQFDVSGLSGDYILEIELSGENKNGKILDNILI